MRAANQSLLFDDLGSRCVQADFSGGRLSRDGGVLLVRQIDRGLGVSRMLAGCFYDRRHPVFVDHQVEELVAQRLLGLALGYEDLNDHDRLRLDPLLAVAVGKMDPLGEKRLQDKGVALAAASTLNRLELSNNKSTRYHKISHDPQKIQQALLCLAVRCLPKRAEEIILDLDGMGHLVHGLQEGRHFNPYYDGYCYQPLYVVCGQIVLWAQLRTGQHDVKDDAVAALRELIAAVRKRCPAARILVRGDAGFCREEIMSFCEAQNQVYYLLGMGKNSKLEQQLAPSMLWAAAQRCLAGLDSCRQFAEFDYQAYSWSRARRLIGKAEVTARGPNPRFVVTNLPLLGYAQVPARPLSAEVIYEQVYCPRANMENVLKQQVLDLRADRMSTHHLASNQLRLWFATFAYLLVERLRTLGLKGTELASATVATIRVQLLKVAACIRISVRRVYVQLCSAFPRQQLFRRCLHQLHHLAKEAG